MLRTVLLLIIALGSLSANETIVRQINHKKLKLKQKDLLQAAHYIDSKAPKGFKPTNKTGLKFPVECDAKNKACFIVLEGKNHFIGSGTHKKVYKAIHYKNRPEVVARAAEKTKAYKEYTFTKKLQGKPGIFKTLGFGKYIHKGNAYRAIYSKLYRPGSLHEALEAKVKLSTYEKLKIAHDMLIGLNSMHEEKIVHRDLAARNFFVDIPQGKPKHRAVFAVVADLGHAMYAKHAAGTKVTGNAKYTPPEGLFLKKMRGKDYYKADIFTVGCVFYWLFYGKQPVWFDKSYAKDLYIPVQYRYNKLKKAINRATKARRKQLSAKKHPTPKEQFEQLLLQMLHTNPAKRGTAKQLAQALNQIRGL